MKDLVIVCAGGFGEEVALLVESINKHSSEGPRYRILGFLDDVVPVGTEVYHGYKVISGISSYQPKENEKFALGISTPKSKEKIYNILKQKGCCFETLVSPNCPIPPETVIGEGSIITLGWIGLNVNIGVCVNIAGSMVGSATIGDFSTTTGFANIAAGHLGKRVFVGSHAVVLNGKKVGDDAKICAGAIVVKNVKAGATVFGNPARELRM